MAVRGGSESISGGRSAKRQKKKKLAIIKKIKHELVHKLIKKVQDAGGAEAAFYAQQYERREGKERVSSPCSI